MQRVKAISMWSAAVVAGLVTASASHAGEIRLLSPVELDSVTAGVTSAFAGGDVLAKGETTRTNTRGRAYGLDLGPVELAGAFAFGKGTSRGGDTNVESTPTGAAEGDVAVSQGFGFGQQVVPAKLGGFALGGFLSLSVAASVDRP